MPFATPGAGLAPTAVSPDRPTTTVPVGERISAPLRKLTIVLVALVLAVTLVAVEAPSDVEAASEAGKVIYTAKNQLGKRYSWGATGMRRYDCSGLVYRVFERNGLLRRIGGGRKTARGYYDWFRNRGLVSRYNPRKGDLVVYGRGKHIGIYIGSGLVVSALTSGVRRHGAKGLNVSFTAYLRVKLSR